MLPKVCLIFNPVAGQSDATADLQIIRDRLTPHFDLTVYETTPDCDGEPLAQQAKQEDFAAILASGGDGTVSMVAGVLMETGIPLGIIPRGTANAFANALELPTDIAAACDVITQGQIKAIDGGYCNGAPLILLAGVGFEAEVIEAANRPLKDRLGALAYWVAGVKELQNLKPFTVELETEDQVITTTAIAVTVANAAPATSIFAQGPAMLKADDGWLDITIVAPTNWTGAIAASQHLLQTAIQNRPAERDDIGYLQAQRVKITTDPPQKVVLDGELAQNTPIEVRCVPRGLNIYVPTEHVKGPTEKLTGLPDLKIEQKSPKPEPEKS